MPKEFEIILIRHGQSVANATGVWQGQLDFPLTDKGRAQARLAGQALATTLPNAIYSSPLSRAYETARLIAEGAGFDGEVVPLSGLLERRGGLLEGTTAQDREARYPDLMRKFLSLEESERWTLVDAEVDQEVLERFEQAIDSIAARYEPGSRIVVVSHGGTMRVFLRSVFGPEVFPDSQRAENASITRFLWSPDGHLEGERTDEGGHQLLELGTTGHLDSLRDLPGP